MARVEGPLKQSAAAAGHAFGEKRRHAHAIVGHGTRRRSPFARDGVWVLGSVFTGFVSHADNYQFFQPTDAAKMGKLQFMARHVVEGVITGQHKSPHKGFSVEFAEHREYVPGDELRHLDWRAYARSDRYYVKLYEQETNLRATLVLDTSGSMRFGEQIRLRPATGGMSGLPSGSTQQDLAGLSAIDESVRWEMPPGSSPSHLDRMFKAPGALEAGNAPIWPTSSTALPSGCRGAAW